MRIAVLAAAMVLGTACRPQLKEMWKRMFKL
jgi:hypothetical protein